MSTGSAFLLLPVPLLLGLLVVPNASAQDKLAALTGVVTAAGPGDPISGAEVRAVDTGASTVTDDAGRFLLSDLAPGEQFVEIWRDGFAPMTVKVNLRTGETLRVPPGLLALELETTGFEERRAKGRGAFLDRGQIDGFGARTVTELLRHVRGVRIRPSLDHRVFGVTMSRAAHGCEPIAFLNGAYFGSTATFDVNALIAVDHLEAMEVYRGITEVPPQFDLPGAQCGVLVFWTQ